MTCGCQEPAKALTYHWTRTTSASIGRGMLEGGRHSSPVLRWHCLQHRALPWELGRQPKDGQVRRTVGPRAAGNGPPVQPMPRDRGDSLISTMATDPNFWVVGHHSPLSTLPNSAASSLFSLRVPGQQLHWFWMCLSVTRRGKGDHSTNYRHQYSVRNMCLERKFPIAFILLDKHLQYIYQLSHCWLPIKSMQSVCMCVCMRTEGGGWEWRLGGGRFHK